MADPALEPRPDPEPEIPRQGVHDTLVLARTAGGLSHSNAVMLDDAEVKKVVPIKAVKVLKISFTTDHKVMRDHTADWDFLGTTYLKPEWAADQKVTAPVSHTKSSPIGLSVSLEVSPADATLAPCSITGAATFGDLTFVGLVPLQGGNNTVTVFSTGVTLKPDTVGRLKGDITWTVKDLSTAPETAFAAGTATGFEVFFTMGAPQPPYNKEEGTTYKRMAKAVELVGNTQKNDPHQVAAALQKLFKEYTLQASATVPKELNHPKYHNDIGGAWCMADHMAEAGECQAMVRFVYALMKQVGYPGTVEAWLVWAELDAKGVVSPKEGVYNDTNGLRTTKTVGNELWRAVLLDRNPEVGTTYDLSTMGPNKFEACIRVTVVAGKPKYYPGGLQKAFDTPTEVLSECFYAFCWVVKLPGGGTGDVLTKFVVKEIVKRWRDESGKILP